MCDKVLSRLNNLVPSMSVVMRLHRDGTSSSYNVLQEKENLQILLSIVFLLIDFDLSRLIATYESPLWNTNFNIFDTTVSKFKLTLF